MKYDQIVSVYFSKEQLEKVVEAALEDDRPLGAYIRKGALEQVKRDK